MPQQNPKRLRSQEWFDDPSHADMTALYVERFMNYGLTREELQSGRPIIGIAQTGSDLAPCNRHHIELAARTKAGIRDAGGIPMEFPVHPLAEQSRRPTAALDRNLAYLGLVEILHGFPLDGVVLTTGCDKTTPACLMAAATVDMPAIVLSGGPMLDGWYEGKRVGSGTVHLARAQSARTGRDRLRRLHAADDRVVAVDRPLQYDGHRALDEQPRRSARHVACRVREHSRGVSRARADGLRDGQAHRRHGARGSEAVEDHDARRVR